MIRFIYVILVITIKDLELQLDNSNLLTRKSAIWFESSAQKEESNK